MAFVFQYVFGVKYGNQIKRFIRFLFVNSFIYKKMDQTLSFWFPFTFPENPKNLDLLKFKLILQMSIRALKFIRSIKKISLVLKKNPEPEKYLKSTKKK